MKVLRKGLWLGHLDDMPTDREEAIADHLAMQTHSISKSLSGTRAQLNPLSCDTWWHLKASLNTLVTTFLNQQK